jgi:hypothetical protein
MWESVRIPSLSYPKTVKTMSLRLEDPTTNRRADLAPPTGHWHGACAATLEPRPLSPYEIWGLACPAPGTPVGLT